MGMTPDRIRYLRRRLGLSQAELGRILNVHQTLISHWERASREPDEYQQDQLAQLYASSKVLNEASERELRGYLKTGAVVMAAALLIGLGSGLINNSLNAGKKVNRTMPYDI